MDFFEAQNLIKFHEHAYIVPLIRKKCLCYVFKIYSLVSILPSSPLLPQFLSFYIIYSGKGTHF